MAKATHKDDALQTQQAPGALAETVPDFLVEFRGQNFGTEAVEQSDLVMPRIALCQELTPQKKKTDPRFIPGLEPGMYFNTVSGKIYGTKLYLIPVKFSKAQMLCKPLNDGGGIICQSFNGKDGGKLSDNCETCEKNSWENGKPECGKLQNFLSAAFDHIPQEGDIPEDYAVLTFKSTSLKTGKQWNSLIRITNLPSFAKVYEVESATENRNNNTYFGHKIRPLGFISNGTFQACKALYEAYKDKDLAVDEGAGHDDTGSTSFADGKDF